MKIKEQSYNGEFIGYKVNGNTFFPKENCEFIKQWIAQGNIPEPEFTELDIQTRKQSEFRDERNALLDKVDKEINKSEDLGNDSTVLRTYRQSLRDATKGWIMPKGSDYGL